jgi:dTDP-4-amino-4,6-dideoxygalactose transaminase
MPEQIDQNKFIPLYDLKLSQAAQTLVARTLASGWLTTGARVADFEQAVGSYLKMRYTAAVSSGTAALMLTLAAMGVRQGKEVVTTPFTFVATLEAIIQLGAVPVLADIDPVTLTIDPDEVSRKINDTTAAIVPVDIGGYPADYDRLGEVAAERPIPLVCDAAHSFGTTFRRKPIAKLVDAATYSFHATKNLTCGEGGMVVSKHKALIEQVRLLSLHGLTATGYQRHVKADWQYDVVAFGHKANLSDIHASVGLGQLEDFDSRQERRREIAARYRKNLADLYELVDLPAEDKRAGHAWHLYIVRLNLSRLDVDRNQIIAMMKEAGIGCGVHYVPMFHLSVFREFGLTEQFFPNAAYAGRRVMSLPMYPELTDQQADRVSEALGTILRQYAC